MTIQFIGTGGLFTRLGKMARSQIDLNVFAAGTLLTDLENILTQFATDPSGWPPGFGQGLAQAISQGLVSIPSSLNILGGTIQGISASEINSAVYYDRPISSNTDLILSLRELIRQMKANSQTVQSCTVTCTSGAAFGITNQGNGVVVTSTKRGDGLVQENLFAEAQTLVCTTDGQPGGGGVAGNETFQWAGELSAPDLWDWQWPLGSGAAQGFTVVNAQVYNDGNNVLVNGDFEHFTVANTPDNWTIVTGSAGSQVFQSLVTFYTGLSSLEFTGDSSTLTAVQQQFGQATTGTSYNPAAEVQLAVNGWIFLSNVPAAGILQVALVDGSGNVVNDTQGTANSYTINLHSQSSGVWINTNGVFRTPNALPAQLNLRLKLTTALSTGTNLFMDQFALNPMTILYTGGPSLSIFAGSINFLAGGIYPGYTVSPPDQFLITMTNNRGGASNNATWQTTMDRLVSMRTLDLLLPSSGSPTILDSLI